MLLHPVTDADIPALVDLANLAFRGRGPEASWNVEDFLDGPRIDAASLREEIAAKPDMLVLIHRDDPGGPLLGSVSLDPISAGLWRLGLLTVRPGLQDRGLGRALMTAAEARARSGGAARIEMSVINVRQTLIAWYGRRGYAPTGETRPFPYGDTRFGTPLRDDLQFVILEKAL